MLYFWQYFNLNYLKCKVCFWACQKKEYFYGVKVTVISNLSGVPKKVIIAPGNTHDLVALQVLNPKAHFEVGSTIYGDAAYGKYSYEDELDSYGIHLGVDRKSNSSRGYKLEDYVNLRAHRKTIETTFSRVTALMGRKIHAVTGRGFEIKILGFILSAGINLMLS